ncbi:hypothetical protein Q5741_11185 [Paenibacillus sp. JX-17]|uniref:DUF4402 domain-containing protein n=1 Tax=Paenibacillus lacisoli TaxID=3064525 RepID=A0ABT9CCI9_9BACL|nr:hypothetical protein [Paenibacillus sp. JX-17]MDO7906979.1 hypothetical protein [Paenibacillus sp. JX-17]
MPTFLDLRTSVQSNTDAITAAIPTGTPTLTGDIGLVTTGAVGQIRVALQGFAKITAPATPGATITITVLRGATVIFTTTFTSTTANEQVSAGFEAADLPLTPAGGLLQYQMQVVASAAGATLGARAFTGIAAAD